MKKTKPARVKKTTEPAEQFNELIARLAKSTGVTTTFLKGIAKKSAIGNRQS